MALASDAAKESPPLDGSSPEDVLDPEALAAVDLTQTEAEVAASGRLSDGAAWENALDVDDLRELADRARRGERVSLQKI